MKNNKKNSFLNNWTSKFLMTAALGVIFTLGSNTANAQMAMTSTSSTATSSQVTIQIMTHLCNSNIKTVDDFQALERGRSPVAALANTVLNCPATGLPQNAAVPGSVASPRTVYDFQVMGENSGTQALSSGGAFASHQLCESDLKLDVNSDGVISSTTCLDISHYQMPAISNPLGVVRVVENYPPAGFHFAVMRFTPPAVDGNNDAVSLRAIDPANGTIILDPMNDADHVIMLHVYNFVNQATVTPPSPGQCTITSDLTSGSRGVEVECLQTYLIQKGFLGSSPTGFFGPLTRKALMKWQAQAAISGTGFFGSNSRNAFNSR